MLNAFMKVQKDVNKKMQLRQFGFPQISYVKTRMYIIILSVRRTARQYPEPTASPYIYLCKFSEYADANFRKRKHRWGR